MSYIWQIQHRLFVEQLEAIETEPTQDQLVRLASTTRLLLALHQVNQEGYCHVYATGHDGGGSLAGSAPSMQH